MGQFFSVASPSFADQCREDRRVGEACRITLAVVELLRQGPLGGSAVIGNKELIGLTST